MIEMTPVQQIILDDPSPRILVAAARCTGKTTVGMARCIKEARKGGTAFFVTSFRVEDSWKTLRALLRQEEEFVSLNERQRSIHFANGGSVSVIHGRQVHTLRGRLIDGLVLDEATFINPYVWEVAEPAVRGWALLISTPEPDKNPQKKNWFTALFSTEGWSRHHVSVGEPV